MKAFSAIHTSYSFVPCKKLFTEPVVISIIQYRCGFEKVSIDLFQAESAECNYRRQLLICLVKTFQYRLQ